MAQGQPAARPADPMRYHRWFTPWVLVAPALAWLLVFNLWPSINTVILSFTNAKPLGGGQFVGLTTSRPCCTTSSSLTRC